MIQVIVYVNLVLFYEGGILTFCFSGEFVWLGGPVIGTQLLILLRDIRIFGWKKEENPVEFGINRQIRKRSIYNK